MLKPVISVFIPSGAGAPGFAGIAACLREDARIRLIAGDVNPQAYGRTLADVFYTMPGSHTEAYVDRLLELVKSERIDVVLPITTRELTVLAKHQSLIESEGARLIISPEKSLEIANDKGTLHLWASQLGIPVPAGGVVHHKREFHTLALSLLQQNATLFFKPVRGNGSRGIGMVESSSSPMMHTGKPELMPLSMDEWLVRLEDDFETPLLLTAYLPGKEYSVDAFIGSKGISVIVPRTRDKMVSGISVSGTFEQHESIMDQSKRLLESLELQGPIGIQWKLDANGIPNLLEINPRLQGTTSALRHLGINVPLLAVKHAVGETHPLPSVISWGRSFTRYWQDVFL